MLPYADFLNFFIFSESHQSPYCCNGKGKTESDIKHEECDEVKQSDVYQ